MLRHWSSPNNACASFLQEHNLETKRKLSRSEEELAVALQQVIAGKHDADTARSIATDTYEPTDRESSAFTIDL